MNRQNTLSSRELTVTQLNAIDLLVTGKTDIEVSETLGVHRVTINKWRNHHIHFQAALNQRRAEIWGAVHDRLRALLPKCLAVLEKHLEHETSVEVALTILKHVPIEMPVGEMDPESILHREVIRRRERARMGNLTSGASDDPKYSNHMEQVRLELAELSDDVIS